MTIFRLNLLHVVLVAARDFRQTLRTRSFWLTMILMPLLPVGLGIFAGAASTDRHRDTLAIIDPDGQTAPALSEALRTSAPDVNLIPVPAALADIASQDPDSARAALQTYIQPPKGTDNPPKGYVIIIPHGFPTDANVQIWATHRPADDVTNTLSSTLAHSMRTAAMTHAGLQAAESARIETLQPKVVRHMPRTGLSDATIARIAPTGLAYLLMIAIVISTQWVLQAMTEERSGKLLEALLACVEPEALLLGKLLNAIGAIALLFVVWATAGLVTAALLAPKIGLTFQQIVTPLLTPRMLVGVPFFLLTGALVMSMVALCAGVMCRTPREAQGMMAPVTLLMVVPVQMLLQMEMMDTASHMLSIARWVPLWTPFLNLSNMNTTPLGIVLAQAVLVLVFCVVEAFVVSRIFCRAIVQDDVKPGWATIRGMLRAP